MKIELSKLQQSIFDKIILSKNNTVLNAGAGSGKTTLLSCLAADFMKQSQRVLFLNVTHRSRLELDDKFSDLSVDSSLLQNRTFHSLCYSFLKIISAHIDRIELMTPYTAKTYFEIPSNLNLLDEAKHIKLLRELAQAYRMNLNGKRALKLYQAYVKSIVQRLPLSEFCFLEDLKNLDTKSKAEKKNEHQSIFQKIIREYEMFKFSNGIISYHDIIEITALILRNDPNTLKNAGIKFDVIIVGG